MSKKAMIICGFPGVGKSCAANNRLNILDAESSPFSWVFDFEHPGEPPERNHEFPKNYITYIKNESESRDFVLVSTHAKVREALREEGIPYIIVAPRTELKNEYMKRYLQRGSGIDFIANIYENWFGFLAEIDEDEAPKIWLEKGEYLSDVLGAAIR